MRYENTRIAYDRYDKLTEPDRFGEIRAIPTDDPLVAHALFKPLHRSDTGLELERPSFGTLHPVFLDSWKTIRAACGRRVKTVVPQRFTDTDADGCGRCSAHAELWRRDPRAWWDQQQDREHVRIRREEEESEVRFWTAENNIDQDEHLTRRIDIQRVDAADWSSNRRPDGQLREPPPGSPEPGRTAHRAAGSEGP